MNGSKKSRDAVALAYGAAVMDWVCKEADRRPGARVDRAELRWASRRLREMHKEAKGA